MARKHTRIHSEHVIPMTLLQHIPEPEDVIVREINSLFHNVKKAVHPTDVTQQGYMVRLEVYADVDRESDE